MATSLTTSLPQWLTGCTYDGDSGNDLRNSGITATWLDTGVLSGASVVGVRGGVTGGAGLAVTPGTGMSVVVAPGSFVVPNSATPADGGYSATLAQQGTLTVQTADPSNPRIDIVCANVVDNGNDTSYGEVQYIAGTAAASPSPPSAPANSITLAQVAVAAAASSVTSGNITDTRPFTITAGGVLPAPKTGANSLAAGYSGLLAWDSASGSFYHLSPSGPEQAHVLPWAPQVSVITSNTSLGTSVITLASAGITTDGQTDIKVTTKIRGLYQSSPADSPASFTVWVDSTQIDEIDVMTNSADEASVSHLGFCLTSFTSSAQGTTPGAGSHTVYWKALGVGGGHTITISAAATAPAVLRVEPVVL